MQSNLKTYKSEEDIKSCNCCFQCSKLYSSDITRAWEIAHTMLGWGGIEKMLMGCCLNKKGSLKKITSNSDCMSLSLPCHFFSFGRILWLWGTELRVGFHWAGACLCTPQDWQLQVGQEEQLSPWAQTVLLRGSTQDLHLWWRTLWSQGSLSWILCAVFKTPNTM